MSNVYKYTALYTKQKTQKTKKWLDGFLQFYKDQAKVVLYDEKNKFVEQSYLNTAHRSVNILELEEGDTFEMDQHLVQMGTLQQKMIAAGSKMIIDDDDDNNTVAESVTSKKTNPIQQKQTESNSKTGRKPFVPPSRIKKSQEQSSSTPPASSTSNFILASSSKKQQLQNLTANLRNNTSSSFKKEEHSTVHQSLVNNNLNSSSNSLSNRNLTPSSTPNQQRQVQKAVIRDSIVQEEYSNQNIEEEEIIEQIVVNDNFNFDDQDEEDDTDDPLQLYKYSNTSLNEEEKIQSKKSSPNLITPQKQIQTISKPKQTTPEIVELLPATDLDFSEEEEETSFGHVKLLDNEDFLKKNSPIVQQKTRPIIMKNTLKPPTSSSTSLEDVDEDEVLVPKRKSIPSKQNSLLSTTTDKDDDRIIIIKPTIPSSKSTIPPKKILSPPKSQPIQKKEIIPLPSVLSIVSKFCSHRHSLYFPDEQSCDVFLSKGVKPSRQVIIPDKFSNINEYRMSFLDGIYEEMNLQLFNLALQYRKSYFSITDTQSNALTGQVKPNCSHGAAVLAFVQKGPNIGKAYWKCGQSKREESCNFFMWAQGNPKTMYKTCTQPISNIQQRQQYFRKNGIVYAHGCELIKTSLSDFSRRHVMSTKQEEEEENEEELNHSNQGVMWWYLKLPDKATKNFAMDDIWIISTSDTFNTTIKDFVLICRSVYHAPNSNGMLQLEIVFGKVPPNHETSSFEVIAIKGPNFATEFEICQNLNQLDPIRLPLLYELLGSNSMPSLVNNKEDQFVSHSKGKIDFKLSISKEQILTILNDHVEQYNLNEDQRKVLQQCVNWFHPSDSNSNETNSNSVVLVHGVFGSGKSYMLVVLILFLCAVLEAAQDLHIRILVSSVTNVAVDNILHGLLKLGFQNFVRVGSQKKMSKAILPYTVITDKSKKEIIKELKGMLQEPMTTEEYEGVKQALEEMESGAFESRKASVKKVKVVGVTCAATAFEVLQDCTFPILILDESSQCLEPLALLPISRFLTQKCICVGDPLQLPPVLTGATDNSKDSLEKTLFLRMKQNGVKPILLRTQYRCHPMIAELSNRMFYANQLEHGISEEDRSALIDNLAPVTLIDTHGKEEFAEGSLYNEMEIKTICHLCQLLQKSRILMEEVGVITFYKTQADRLMKELAKLDMKKIKVSTVDAFQGGEKEIILVSTVKASFGVGFIDSSERLNVAITRARRHLIIIGKQMTLTQSALWKFIVQQATDLDAIYKFTTLLNASDFSFLRLSQRWQVKTAQETTPINKAMHALMDVYSPKKRKRLVEEEEETATTIVENSKKQKLSVRDDLEREDSLEEDAILEENLLKRPEWNEVGEEEEEFKFEEE